MKHKIHVKLGDTVQIISGKHKGEISEVIKVIPKKGQVVVKDVNLKVKHARPTQEGSTGQIVQFEASIHSSNVMLYRKEQKKRSRYGIQIKNNKQKKRILKKTQEIF